MDLLAIAYVNTFSRTHIMVSQSFEIDIYRAFCIFLIICLSKTWNDNYASK